jgi:hypothetical protein
MTLTNDELVTLNNYFNGEEELPADVEAINDNIKAILYPVVDAPMDATIEAEVNAPAVEPAPVETPVSTEPVTVDTSGDVIPADAVA